MRACGDCQLCCKLLPTRELSKPANTRCEHQKRGLGCTIYAHRPPSCKLWSCRWLLEDDTADLSRPDRSGYVIDVMPDYITARDNLTGATTNVPVLQIWCDPAKRHAHRDPHLRRYLERRAAEGMAAIVRYGSKEAITLVAPAMNEAGRWLELANGIEEKEHRPEDFLAAGFNLDIQVR